MSSESDGDETAMWDLPIIQLENQLHPERPRMVTLDVSSERQELLNSSRNKFVWPSPTARNIQPPPTDDFNGPYDFRQLLRPTEHLPTESLRKRLGSRCRASNVKAM